MGTVDLCSFPKFIPLEFLCQLILRIQSASSFGVPSFAILEANSSCRSIDGSPRS